jgi:hypothetical protein
VWPDVKKQSKAKQSKVKQSKVKSEIAGVLPFKPLKFPFNSQTDDQTAQPGKFTKTMTEMQIHR